MGRSHGRAPEKAVASALEILLIAERAALLAGRDDEFVAVTSFGFTGMRFGEMVGLETEFVRASTIRVEWQLYELDTGELHRCPPKDGSRRTIDIPDWHTALLADLIRENKPKPCACHGLTYVFRGLAPANGSVRHPGPRVIDVARLAGVSTGTVANVLNGTAGVSPATRDKVDTAVSELGYMRGWNHGELAAHWRRNSFTTWLFRPAATGWYPSKAPQPARPVPILGEPWPGIPVRGRGAINRATACWLPIAKRLTPHGLRHSHKTVMDELSVPSQLKDERMGHEDGSVQARYSHVTPEMRRRLLNDLTTLWTEALEARRRIDARSPVPALDRLLRPT
jgi:integrase